MFLYLSIRTSVLVMSVVVLSSCRKETAATPAELAKAHAAVEKDHWNVRSWYEKRFIGAYLKSARHEPRWDDSITNMFKLVAALRSGEGGLAENGERIKSVTASVIAEGCTDPLVRYLNLRYGAADGLDTAERGAAYRVIALEMPDLDYPPDIVFYPCIRAARALKGKNGEVSAETYQMRQNALESVVKVLGDKSCPPAEVRMECLEMLALVKLNPQMYAEAWQKIESPLFKNWSQYSFPNLLKAEHHYNLAWAARGGGFADSVSKDSWKTYEKELKRAENSFRDAWKIDNTDPETARWMIEICVSLSYPREEMETWFQRAMVADPGYFPACRTKLRYLEPKWGGSPEAMIAFGRECLTNSAYKGDVTTTLVEAYKILAGYYHDEPAKLAQFYAWPQLWRDVSDVYTEVARRDPDATWYHNNLAWYAWRCGKWDALAQEVAKIQKPNYSYFGGETGYQKMLEALKVHTKQ